MLKQDRLTRGQMREKEEKRQKQIDRKQVGRMMFASACVQQRDREKYSDSDGSSGSPRRKSNKKCVSLWPIKLGVHTFSLTLQLFNFLFQIYV